MACVGSEDTGFAMRQDIGNSSASGHRRQLCVTPLV